jgi:hypothetical protein
MGPRWQSQAYSVAVSVNRKWGFGGYGEPIEKVFDADTKRRAILALEELKRILANIGLPLVLDWPSRWSPEQHWVLNPFEIVENVCPPSCSQRPWYERLCSMCRQHKELVFAGCVCASCCEDIAKQLSL